jgi:hypothetical protein
MKRLILLVCLVLSATPAVADQMPVPPVDTAAARKACTDAMNADPAFAKSIIETVDKQIDQKTIDAHLDADKHIRKNEKHVILAYAAMWIVAALFLGFLWMRQQSLKSEIASLRKDLDAAAKEGKA